MSTEQKKTTRLSDIIDRDASKVKKKSSTVEFKTMDKVVEDDRPWKIQMEGNFKEGKSRFCLSVLLYLYHVLKLKPEEICVVWIDLDNGLIPLVKQGLIPPELEKRILYYMCSDFSEVLEATDKALVVLNEHKSQYGLRGAWLIVDNMGIAWEGARDLYSLSVYGVPMKDKIMDAKKKALQKAAQKGKTDGRIPAVVFDQMTDYAVINPLHNEWAEQIKNSGVNFIWTALLKYEETEVSGNKKIKVVKPEGQKFNSARVDFIIRKFKDDNAFFGSLIGSRYTENVFTRIKDLNFTKFVEEIDKIMDAERKIRQRKWDKLLSNDDNGDEPKEEEDKTENNQTEPQDDIWNM